MRLNLLKPVRDVAERGLLRAIVNEDDSHGAFVVRLRDCSEALLSGGVPHLELDALVLNVNCLDLEVDACKNMTVNSTITK